VLGWEEHLDAVRDYRRQPRIPTSAIVRSVVVMFLARLGSLNALEQTRPSRFWHRWVGPVFPSADTVGRVSALMQPDDIRSTIHHAYSRLKRMKALEPMAGGLTPAILDAHESHATYRRHCAGCLERVIHTAGGDRVQYYHRHVTIMLVARDLHLLLDAEPIRPGEDEVAAAIRLLKRVVPAYPRAFDVVLCDGEYADSRFFKCVVGMRKDVIAVLKDERRDLLKDARSLFEQVRPTVCRRGKRQCLQWDIEGFTSWPQVGRPVRVVRTLEKWTVRRQLTEEIEQCESEWIWVTTLPQARAGTELVVKFGHARWMIENEGFNELTNRQHVDHVYKHDAVAMLVFCLLGMLCLNVFLVFYRRNLKPAFRRTVSMVHVARLILAELYQGIPRGAPCAPT